MIEIKPIEEFHTEGPDFIMTAELDVTDWEGVVGSEGE